MNLRRIGAAWLLLAIAFAGACDGEDREVLVVKDPQRIVSLSPFVTEILFALGVGDRVVGATQYCVYPDAAKEIPRIGDMNASYELIMEKNPDLVLATEGDYVRDTLRLLERAGVRAVGVPSHGSAEGRLSIRAIGRLVNRAEKAEEIIKEIDRAFEKFRGLTAALPKTRVLVVGWDNANMTAMGKGSTIDTIIEAVGGKNVVESSGEKGYIINFSAEAAVDLAPEVIIVSDWQTITPEREKMAAERWARLTSIPAVQSVPPRIYVINANIIDRIGPRVCLGLAEMAAAIHPKIAGRGSTSR